MHLDQWRTRMWGFPLWLSLQLREAIRKFKREPFSVQRFGSYAHGTPPDFTKTSNWPVTAPFPLCFHFLWLDFKKYFALARSREKKVQTLPRVYVVQAVLTFGMQVLLLSNNSGDSVPLRYYSTFHTKYWTAENCCITAPKGGLLYLFFLQITRKWTSESHSCCYCQVRIFFCSIGIVTIHMVNNGAMVLWAFL
jgi:hypothetical protein